MYLLPFDIMKDNNNNNFSLHFEQIILMPHHYVYPTAESCACKLRLWGRFGVFWENHKSVKRGATWRIRLKRPINYCIQSCLHYATIKPVYKNNNNNIYHAHIVNIKSWIWGAGSHCGWWSWVSYFVVNIKDHCEWFVVSESWRWWAVSHQTGCQRQAVWLLPVRSTQQHRHGYASRQICRYR